ncbi:MAG: alpha/beta fold hydrolase [Ectothiorhodospiraceae bacterium]|nr:alpha/beta fold hydrolase [Ectothiorhodospiraceae bacterium]
MSQNPTVRFCRVAGDFNLAYASLGEGRPLSMAPGWVCLVHELGPHPAAARARAKLAQRRRFIWYDRLGCGLSDRSGFPLSLDNDVEQLAAVMDAAGIERASLVGYSFGAPPAAAFAARYPERVDRLVFCSGFARGGAIATDSQFQGLKHIVRMHWGLGSRTLAAIILPTGSSSDLQWFTHFQRSAATAEMTERLLDHIRTMDVRAILPGVRAPTLVIHNRDDHAVPLSAGKEIAALVPGARLHVLEGNEHDPFIRDKGELVETILDFIDGRPVLRRKLEQPDREPLTAREREVLKLLAEGMSNKQIASTLSIASATVERHVTNIYAKINVRCRAEAAFRAIELRLATAPQPC